MWLDYIIASLKAFQKAGYSESHVVYVRDETGGNQHSE